MKQITKNTILKQGDKTFQPVEGIDKIIFWIDKPVEVNIVAQSQPKLEGIPVISLDSYVKKFKKEYNSGNNSGIFTKGIEIGIEIGYNSNPNQYTQKDIEKVIKLARQQTTTNMGGGFYEYEETYSNEEIFEEINFISVIEVDDNFQILNYE
jgi:hypothetical protein